MGSDAVRKASSHVAGGTTETTAGNLAKKAHPQAQEPQHLSPATPLQLLWQMEANPENTTSSGSSSNVVVPREVTGATQTEPEAEVEEDRDAMVRVCILQTVCVPPCQSVFTAETELLTTPVAKLKEAVGELDLPDQEKEFLSFSTPSCLLPRTRRTRRNGSHSH